MIAMHVRDENATHLAGLKIAFLKLVLGAFAAVE